MFDHFECVDHLVGLAFKGLRTNIRLLFQTTLHWDLLDMKTLFLDYIITADLKIVLGRSMET